MVFVPTPLTARVCIRGRLAGQQICNILHVRCPNDPTHADLLLIAAIVADKWAQNILPVLHNSYVFEAVEARDISVQGAEGIVFPIPGNATGFMTGDGLPNNVALAVKLLTGYTGRSRRGRIFLGGIPRARLDGQNSPDDVIKQAAVDFITDLITRLAEETMILVVTSLVGNGQPRIEGMTTPITGAEVNDVLDSQRRRLPERGD